MSFRVEAFFLVEPRSHLAEHLRGRVEPDFAEVLLEPRLYRRVESSQTFWTESQRRAQVKLRYLGSLREYDEFAKDVGSSHVFGSTIPCVDLFDQWSVVRRFLIDDDLGLLIKHFTSCPIIRQTISIHLLSEWLSDLCAPAATGGATDDGCKRHQII
jgi:hypothetical protein